MHACQTFISDHASGLESLDLSGAAVEDDDVLALFLQPLKRLRQLNLSGCKKLTPRLCDVLACSTTSGRLGSCLRALNLQRCFQLNGSCLRRLLDACSEAAMSLDCLAMSHLDLSGGPGCRFTLPVGGGMSRLRVLALNNCTRLGADLASVAKLCPRLTHLFLGGSTFGAMAPAPADKQLPDGCGPSGIDVMMAVRSAVMACPALHGTKFSSGGAREMIISSAAVLVAIALSLPELQALEVSFAPQAVVSAVTTALGAADASSGGTNWRRVPEVWDLTQEVGVRQALSAVTRAAAVMESGQAVRDDRLPSLLLALRCAASCSSSARATPLHTAAFSGNRAVLCGLLKLGAVLDARDVGGATALFLAAEAGRTASVKELLDAGANAMIANAAGESPLYIASLKGHLDVVQILVIQGFLARQVPWHKLRYADGWTPLMAAVVAEHFEVAQWLLSAAAGVDAAAGEALDLICAANRYGQSVLHIAARKGSPKLLRLLLEAGGFSALGLLDCSGDTPMDVAVKHSHTVAMSEFARLWRA